MRARSSKPANLTFALVSVIPCSQTLERVVGLYGAVGIHDEVTVQPVAKSVTGGVAAHHFSEQPVEDPSDDVGIVLVEPGVEGRHEVLGDGYGSGGAVPRVPGVVGDVGKQEIHAGHAQFAEVPIDASPVLSRGDDGQDSWR